MISLQKKISVITGGSRGIGAASAILLAKAGSDVVINYIQNETEAESVAEQVRSLGRRAILHRGNIGCATTAKDLVDTAVKTFGRIDIVVNNAGIWTYGAVGGMDPEIWDETIEVNLRSVFNICNAAVPYLKLQRSGRIINISSTAGQRGEAFHSHYAATKGGILAFTKSLAIELAPYGILVNAVAPGWVDTEMNAEVFAEPSFKQNAIDNIPLKKIATSDDVAGSVLFLASQFSNHITGSTISVNGGAVLT